MINRIDRAGGSERPQPARPEPPSSPRPTIARDTVLIGQKPAPAAKRSPGVLSEAAVAALVGSSVFVAGAELVKLKKGINDIKKLSAKMDKAAAAGADGFRERFKHGVKAYNAKQLAPETALKALTNLDRLDSGIRALSGVNAALGLKDSLAALKDGATTVEIATVAGDALAIVRGSDSMAQLLKNAKRGLIPLKLAPGVSAAAGLADAIKRWDKLSTQYDTLTPTDKFAQSAYLVSDVADMLGVIPVAYPFTKVFAGGFALVGLAAESVDRLRSKSQSLS